MSMYSHRDSHCYRSQIDPVMTNRIQSVPAVAASRERTASHEYHGQEQNKVRHGDVFCNDNSDFGKDRNVHVIFTCDGVKIRPSLEPR